MLRSKYHKRFTLVCVLLCACITLSACATQSVPPETSPPAGTATPAPTPTPTPVPTPAPLPDIGTLSAQWDPAAGMVLTWTAFGSDFICTLERKDTDSGDFATITEVDTTTGTCADAQPGEGGSQLVYRLCVRDGERAAYSQEIQALVPFDFGNTGGNLANGGISCDLNNITYRMTMQQNVAGVYALDADGQSRLLAEGLVSQLNVSDDYLYYVTYDKGQLYRVPLDGSQQPQLIYDQKMLFVLAVGDRIYATLDDSGALIAMNDEGTGVETLVEKGCYDLGGYGQLLYYTNTADGTFCMLDLVTGETKTIPMAKRSFAQIWDGRIYYQNEKDGKKLYSCALDGSDAKVLLDKEITGLNVTARGAYCANNDDGGRPYLVALDGASAQKLADVKVSYIAISGTDVLIYDTKGNFYVMDETGALTKMVA